MPWIGTGMLQPEWLLGIANTKVSLWPQPNTNRISPRFRMVNGEGKPYPRAVRHLISFRPRLTPNTYYNGWLDLAVIDENHLSGTTGVSEFGIEVVLDVRQYRSPVTDPNFNQSGISYDITYSRLGFADDYHWGVMANWDTTSGGPGVPLNVDFSLWLTGPSDRFNKWTEPVAGLDTDWEEAANILNQRMHSQSECFQNQSA